MSYTVTLPEPSESVFINPLTDFGFKFLFGRDADKEFSISLLNAVLRPTSPIVNIEFIDKENKGKNKKDRALIYDLHCKLDDGSKIIVEMQNRYQTYFDDRALYYLSGDIYAQGLKGDAWKYQLTPVYGIFIMNFEWREVEEQHLREDVCLVNMQTRQVFSDKLRMTFLKLPFMNKSEEECKDTLDRWLFILKNMDRMKAIPQSFMQDPVFRRLGTVSRVAALNAEQRAEYDASLKAYRDNYAIAETERAIGREEGFEKGLEKGMEKGLQKGEAMERMKSIRIMLSLGVSPKVIASKYAISPEEVIRISESQ